MTLFYLIRHGEPDWEINEQYKLIGHGRGLVPLMGGGIRRVLETTQDKRLKEAELGDDYDAHNGVYPPGETRAWESKESLKNRMDGVIGKYLDYSKVIVAGHGMAFRTLVGEIGDIPHASVIEFNR